MSAGLLLLEPSWDTDLLTVLDFIHVPSGAPFVMVCEKGAVPYVVEGVLAFMEFLGLQKVCLRTDGEPASGALARAISRARSGETQLETTPRYSSASLGAVERSNRTVEGQIRCMRSALEYAVGKTFGI